jgi:RNA polymerase sigma factor (sigma-70 family)
LNDPPLPKQKWAITPEAFDLLLSWLDPNRERAGEKYEEIRARLIKRFRQHGCGEPEQLANETIDRVARKLPEIIATYEGDPVPYFYAVAHYVHIEFLRSPAAIPLSQTDVPIGFVQAVPELFDEDESLNACLKHCMDKLAQRDRELILQYYQGERQVKIKLRKELAEGLGIKLANLRLQTQRIRAKLKTCILDCLNRKALA